MPEPAKIRNVAVVGHRGTGKTSLVEALLFQSGAINRLGTVEAGTTVSDSDEDEHKRQLSISMSLAHAEWQERKLNLVDVPGDPSFQGELRTARARRRGRARHRLGRDGRRGRHDPRLEARRRARARAHRLREHARPRARATSSARSRRSAPSSTRTASPCTSRSARSTSSPASWTSCTCARTRARRGRRRARPARSRTRWRTSPPSTARSSSTRSSRPTRGSWSATSRARSSAREEVAAALKAAVTNGEVFPVACGVATKNLGTHAVLDLLVEGVPSPAKKALVHRRRRRRHGGRSCSRPSPIPFAGRINLFRVLKGTVTRRLDAREPPRRRARSAWARCSSSRARSTIPRWSSARATSARSRSSRRRRRATS